MKTKAAIIGGSEELQNAFSSDVLFAGMVLNGIVKDIFGVKDVGSRPAEYYVQAADIGPSINGNIGVEIRMTGISRNGRTPKLFHQALAKLEDIAETLALGTHDGATKQCQIFCVLMLDGDIEIAPGSGKYSSVLEGTAFYAGKRRQKSK